MTSTVPTTQQELQRQPESAGAAAVPPPDGQRSVRRRLARRWARVQESGEAGMSTAEYAVGTVAACAFAAVLYQVVTGGSVVDALGDLVQSALSTLS
ncbi:DUF4244 domain-containing protein [Modestobacter lapidis]|nr:DUF4244 domain-containing protein [Modestobacter lapidis]